MTVTSLAPRIAELGKPHVTASGERADYTRLEAHLRRYTARNTFDYFIHKDLGTFLRRELDFYIKNEVMHLDDVENETAPRVEQYLSLYLLRNLSKGRGVGFFEAGNFHPDFILWLLAGGRQHVIFVDPKGIRNLGATDPKIQFHETIKEIEVRLGDSAVRLQSFIVSNTPSATMQMLWGIDKSEMQKRHVLFQEEDRASYVRSMLEGAGA